MQAGRRQSRQVAWSINGEQTLQVRCESERLRRQQESVEQCEQRLQARQVQSQQISPEQSLSAIDKFKADLQTTLDYFRACLSLVFADKAKQII